MNEVIDGTNAELLSPLDELTGFELTVRMTSKIVEENVTPFKKKALAAIATINTDLNTDDEFDRAKKDVKGCAELKRRLREKKEDIISGNKSVEALVSMVDEIYDTVSKTEKLLDTTIKKRDIEKKAYFVKKGLEMVHEVWSVSPVKHAFFVDKSVLESATKHKKKYSSMEDAVNIEAEKQIADIRALEAWYEINIVAISDAETHHPGIFPDKKTIALGNPDMVALLIVSRVETQKRKLREAEELAASEKKAKEERAEAERKASAEREQAAIKWREQKALEEKELAEKKAAELTKAVDAELTKSFPAEGGFDFSDLVQELPPDPFSSASFNQKTKEYTLTVDVVTEDIKYIIEKIHDILGVIYVKINQ